MYVEDTGSPVCVYKYINLIGTNKTEKIHLEKQITNTLEHNDVTLTYRYE